MKKDFYTPIYELIKQTTNLTIIQKKLNISKQSLNYYLNNLKKKGLIKQISKGLWEITSSKNNPNDTLKNEVRGHAFIWKVKLPKIKNWEKRIELLNKHKIDYKLVGINKKIPRIYIKDKKVWLAEQNIVIYDTQSYYANNSIESRKYAIYELSLILALLESKLGINLKPYTFKPKREHYALVKNDLAIQMNKNNEKLYVYDNGANWMVIDNSYNLNECEFFTTNQTSGLTNSTGAQGYFNSHKNTNWKVTPEFTLEALNKLSLIQAENQKQVMQFTEQIKSHLALIQEYRKENIKYREEVKKKVYLKESQTTLGDY